MSDEGMKYRYVKRNLYDNYVDRTAKRFDRIIHQLAVQESWIANLEEHIGAMNAEIEALRLDKTAVVIAGKREALKRHD